MQEDGMMASGVRIGLRMAMVLAVLCLGRSSAATETIEGVYRSGLKDYYAGHFDQATEKLERVAALPVRNEELFYNLGCAYFRQGKLGPAIYNYERALALEPSFDDARFNLDRARAAAASQVTDVLKGASVEPWWVKLVKRLSVQGWWTVAISVWWLFLGLMLAVRYVGAGPARAALIATDSFVAALLLCATLLLTARIQLVTTAPEAIVLPREVSAREGPDAAARESFKLHAGLRVRVKGESNNWLRVRLTNGLEGWVQRPSVGVL